MLRKLKIETFDRRTLWGRRYFFRIKAANGEVIAQSEGYRNRLDRDGATDLLTTRDYEVVRTAR